jgi:hypothetical protein
MYVVVVAGGGKGGLGRMGGVGGEVLIIASSHTTLTRSPCSTPLTGIGRKLGKVARPPGAEGKEVSGGVG